MGFPFCSSFKILSGTLVVAFAPFVVRILPLGCPISPFVASPILAFPRLFCHAGILRTLLSFGTFAFQVRIFCGMMLDLAASLAFVGLNSKLAGPTNFIAAAFCRPPLGVFHVLRRRRAPGASSIYSRAPSTLLVKVLSISTIVGGLRGRLPCTPLGPSLLAF